MDRIAALFILFIIIFATTLGFYTAIKFKIEEIKDDVLKYLKAMENTKDKKETIENTKMTLDELFDRLNTDSIVISFDKYKLEERFNYIIMGNELIIQRKGEQHGRS